MAPIMGAFVVSSSPSLSLKMDVQYLFNELFLKCKYMW